MTTTSVHPRAPHAQSAPEVAVGLEVDPGYGLTEAQARTRLELIGPNQLAEVPRRPALLRFLDQFRSVLILVLIGAAVLAGLVGEIKDVVVIAVVLVINASIGFFQEQRAEKSLEALRNMLTPTARVRREGGVRVIDAGGLVPGDIVLLEAGDRVPADARLVIASSVKVDESSLTGESQPVGKRAEAIAAEDEPLAERVGMIHMNTALTRGRAEGIVTSTGMQTSVGAIADMLATGEEPQTPLQRQLDSLGKRLAMIGLIAVSLYVTLALLQGEAPSEIALRAVALAVATVPEGLPAVLALTLALGVHRMAGRNAIVKRLASVETLGSATVICSDKTGTLTLNEMTVREVLVGDAELVARAHGSTSGGDLLDTSGEPVALPALLLDALALCSDAELVDGAIIGDPTEGALLVLAAKGGLDIAARRRESPRVEEIPFDSDYKYMATYHEERPGRTGRRVMVKGAADVLLARCDAQLIDGRVEPLTDKDRERRATGVARMGERGLRVLAIATRRVDQPARDQHTDVTGLTLLGLVGIADPPRPEAAAAVALCHKAGVAVKMITGDHIATAAAIAREIGIEGRALTGADVANMTPEDLAAVVDDVAVFARVAPEHKVAIVRALTANGHIVAMTGDGVNDAAALRSAHIGVAMGQTGTEVTKEAGDVILTDDNFATIVGAVGEGRAIYDNVVKFVRFQLSTNIGAISTFLGASVMGLPAPLTAVQILWVNIIMDGPPAMALGVDPARPGIMSEPPRRSGDQILSIGRLIKLFRVGLIMAGGTLSVLVLARNEWGQTVSLTMAFTTFVLFQLVNAPNARVESTTVFSRHTLTNRWLWASLVTVAILHVAAVHTPWGQAIFDTVALTAGQWALCIGVALCVLVVEELVKLSHRVVAGRARA